MYCVVLLSKLILFRTLGYASLRVVHLSPIKTLIDATFWSNWILHKACHGRGYQPQAAQSSSTDRSVGPRDVKGYLVHQLNYKQMHLAFEGESGTLVT